MRAETPSEQAAAGQTCNAPADEGHDVTTQLLLEQLRRAQIETGSAPSGEGPVVLNNRGFNYGPPPTIDPLVYKRTAAMEKP